MICLQSQVSIFADAKPYATGKNPFRMKFNIGITVKRIIGAIEMMIGCTKIIAVCIVAAENRIETGPERTIEIIIFSD